MVVAQRAVGVMAASASVPLVVARMVDNFRSHQHPRAGEYEYFPVDNVAAQGLAAVDQVARQAQESALLEAQALVGAPILAGPFWADLRQATCYRQVCNERYYVNIPSFVVMKYKSNKLCLFQIKGSCDFSRKKRGPGGPSQKSNNEKCNYALKRKRDTRSYSSDEEGKGLVLCYL